MSCQKPQCPKDSTETYTGKHGNELDLCSKHYYELVSGKKVRESNLATSTGIGRELTRDIQDGSSVGDGLLDFEPGKGGTGTTPCPNCGKPMGMVSWTGEKPTCHRCQDEPTRWMGILDPYTGEELGPTMNEYTDTTQDDVKIPVSRTY